MNKRRTEDMARFFNRSTCAVLLAGVLSCFVPASNVCGAVCNPAPGKETELVTFTVTDANNTGNKAVVTSASPSSNPGKLYICGDTATITMAATVTAGAMGPPPSTPSTDYVGWRIEKASGKGTGELVPPWPGGNARPSEGNAYAGCLLGESIITALAGGGSGPTVREFYVKPFCDGNRNCLKDPGEDCYYDTDGKVIEVQVVVLKVDIAEVASDQIAGNECNTLPTAFYKGEPNNPMLMATRSGKNAHLTVKATVLPNGVTSAYIGVRKVGEPALLASSQIVPLVTPTHLEFDAYDDSEAIAAATLMCEVVSGIDANNNNALNSLEVCTVFEKTPRTDDAGNPATAWLNMVDKIIVVTESQFLISKGTVIGYNFVGSAYAGDLIEAFGKGATTVPQAFVTLNVPISTATPGLSHHVGAKWDANCVDKTYRFTFPDGTEAANDFEESNALSQIIDSVIQSNIAALLAAGTADWTESPGMSFTQSKNLFVTEPDPWGINELGLAFGTVTINGTLGIKYRKTNPNTIEVQQIKAEGSFDDLYDFSYWGGEYARQASMVQAGHATLSTLAEPSGKVFFTRLQYSTEWKNRPGTYTSPSP
jgi:hypothetical protein